MVSVPHANPDIIWTTVYVLLIILIYAKFKSMIQIANFVTLWVSYQEENASKTILLTVIFNQAEIIVQVAITINSQV